MWKNGNQCAYSVVRLEDSKQEMRFAVAPVNILAANQQISLKLIGKDACGRENLDRMQKYNTECGTWKSNHSTVGKPRAANGKRCKHASIVHRMRMLLITEYFKVISPDRPF